MGLNLKNVVKNYGEKVAVEGITLEMKTPGVFGLLGTNGARKNNNN